MSFVFSKVWKVLGLSSSFQLTFYSVVGIVVLYLAIVTLQKTSLALVLIRSVKCQFLCLVVVKWAAGDQIRHVDQYTLETRFCDLQRIRVEI